jgi:hypothetical protein
MQTDMLKEKQEENVESHRTHKDRKGILAERHQDRKVSNRLKGMCKGFETDLQVCSSNGKKGRLE